MGLQHVEGRFVVDIVERIASIPQYYEQGLSMGGSITEHMRTNRIECDDFVLDDFQRFREDPPTSIDVPI